MATTVSYSASMRTRKTNSASNAKSSAASQEYYENTYNYVGIVHFAGMPGRSTPCGQRFAHCSRASRRLSRMNGRNTSSPLARERPIRWATR
mgnify:CR=1 FL=1